MALYTRCRGRVGVLLATLVMVVVVVVATDSGEPDQITRLNDWARDHLTSSHHLHIASSRRVIAAGDIKVSIAGESLSCTCCMWQTESCPVPACYQVNERESM